MYKVGIEQRANECIQLVTVILTVNAEIRMHGRTGKAILIANSKEKINTMLECFNKTFFIAVYGGRKNH